jgi:hypothetical protein
VPKPIWLNLGFDLATSIDSLFISIGWLIMPLTTVVYWASKRTSERPI